MRDREDPMPDLFAVPSTHRTSCAKLNAERREVLESVLAALASEPPDPDEMSACSYLLDQLARAIAPRTATRDAPRIRL